MRSHRGRTKFMRDVAGLRDSRQNVQGPSLLFASSSLTQTAHNKSCRQLLHKTSVRCLFLGQPVVAPTFTIFRPGAILRRIDNPYRSALGARKDSRSRLEQQLRPRKRSFHRPVCAIPKANQPLSKLADLLLNYFYSLGITMETSAGSIGGSAAIASSESIRRGFD